MHQKQQDIAQNDMAQWLADPHELGKEPGRIECAAMVEKIRAYWIAQAEKFTQQ